MDVTIRTLDGERADWISDDELRKRGVGGTPGLPRTKYVFSLITGKVMPWTETFARRSDIYANCDANGDTDPAAWAADVVVAEANSPRARLAKREPAEIEAALKTSRELAAARRELLSGNARARPVKAPVRESGGGGFAPDWS